MFTVSEALSRTYPGAKAGVLVMRDVANPPEHAGLDLRKDELENDLRARFAGGSRATVQALPAIQAYNAYYAPFKKTYHVQLQLESVAFKGKRIPRVAALVEAMFVAELKNQLLTAGHDVSALDLPVTLDVATGDERYTLLNGQEQVLKPGDMFMADRKGVISSVLYGPDNRTPIGAETSRALFTVYVPPGIAAETVAAHLQDIRDNVLLVAPQAGVEILHVYGDIT